MPRAAFIGVLLASILFTGCQKEVVSCADPAVKEIIFELYKTEIQNKVPGNLPDPSTITQIRTTSLDEKIAQRTCEATLTFTNEVSGDFSYKINHDAEDHEQFYVQITETNFMTDLAIKAIAEMAN